MKNASGRIGLPGGAGPALAGGRGRLERVGRYLHEVGGNSRRLWIVFLCLSTWTRLLRRMSSSTCIIWSLGSTSWLSISLSSSLATQKRSKERALYLGGKLVIEFVLQVQIFLFGESPVVLAV